MAIQITLSIIKTNAISTNVIRKIYSRSKTNDLRFVTTQLLQPSNDVA